MYPLPIFGRILLIIIYYNMCYRSMFISISRRTDSMQIEQLIESTRRELPRARFEHTLRVQKLAVKYAEQMGIDKERTSIAAILHDYCKFWSNEKLISWIRKYNLPNDLLDYHPELWHAPVGAEVAARHFGITDQEILQAIRYH